VNRARGAGSKGVHSTVDKVVHAIMTGPKSPEALERVLDGVELSSACYSALIVELGRKRQKRLAADTIRWMRSRAEQPSSQQNGGGGAGAGAGARGRGVCRPGVRHYNALIRAFDRARDWKEAVRCLEVMRQDGVTPDIVSYNTVISALRRAPDFLPRILALYDEMLAVGQCATYEQKMIKRARYSTYGQKMIKRAKYSTYEQNIMKWKEAKCNIM